jgi:hypothetical protein
MVKTLTKLAKFLRPIGKGTDEIIAVRLSSFDITVAEVRVKSNVIHIENIATKPLTRNLNFANLPRQHDMRDQGLFAAADAGIIIPSGIATLKQVNLPFLNDNELAKEAKDPGFWAEVGPDLANLEDPYIAFYKLVSSENDDLTRVVVAYAEQSALRPWADVLLGAHLNPVYIDLEPIALANYLYANLPRDERRQSQAILHITADYAEIIAFHHTRFHTIKIEITEFDLVLLSEIEDVTDPSGAFWDEVGVRVGNALKQTLLFLQEEQDFLPFSVVYVAIENSRTQSLMLLLNRHLNLAPLTLWDTTLGAELAPPAAQALASASNASCFAVPFGLGMRKLGTFGDNDPGLINLSLLPHADNLRRNRQMGVVARTLVKFWGTVTVVMGAWTLGLVVPAFTDSQTKSRNIESIREQAQNVQNRLNGVRQQTTNLDIELTQLALAKQPRGKALILDKLPDLVPEGAELSTYSIQNNTTLAISGSAISEEVIFLFVSELVNTDLVDNPQAIPTARDDGYFDFILNGTLRQEQ